MHWDKLAWTAIFSALIFLPCRPTSAQSSEWCKEPSAAVTSNERGEYALAQKLYRLDSKAEPLDARALGIW